MATTIPPAAVISTPATRIPMNSRGATMATTKQAKTTTSSEAITRSGRPGNSLMAPSYPLLQAFGALQKDLGRLGEFEPVALCEAPGQQHRVREQP